MLTAGDAGTHPNHWCWSGTNAKGKWGIFPQSHIELSSVNEFSGSDRSSIASGEKKKGESLLTRFSSRKVGRSQPDAERLDHLYIS